MPTVRATRRFHFAAAHRLHRPDWPADQNREVFGACNNPNWHGHNYEVDVTVEGPVDPETGYLMDLKRLRELLDERIVRDVDHKNLNVEVSWMSGLNPTTENLAVAMWGRIAGELPPGVRLAKVVVHETPRNSVEYTGEE